MTRSSEVHGQADDDGVAAIVAHLRAAGESAPVTDASTDRIMAALRQRPVPTRSSGVRAIFQNRLPWYAPRMAAAAAAALVLFGAGVAVGRSFRADGPVLTQTGPASATRFVLAAPDVRGVAVVGDFNGWDRTATPMKRDARTGQWKVDLPLPAGRYTYAFVVDGGRWVPDPAAPLAPADDYGQRNSVLLVNASYIPSVTR